MGILKYKISDTKLQKFLEDKMISKVIPETDGITIVLDDGHSVTIKSNLNIEFN